VYRLKGNSIELVKIADFGLSAFYRPGSTQKVHCGTLTFLAPEAFGDAANAGPPLDVWALGVILFTMLCGRLPFDDVDSNTNTHGHGDDKKGKKRRSHSVIQSKILRGHYRTDNDLLPEEKDLIRKLLTVDPAARCSLPEALVHPWMKMTLSDVSPLSNPANMSPGMRGDNNQSIPGAFTPQSGSAASAASAAMSQATTPTPNSTTSGVASIIAPAITPPSVMLPLPEDAVLEQLQGGPLGGGEDTNSKESLEITNATSRDNSNVSVVATDRKYSEDVDTLEPIQVNNYYASGSSSNRTSGAGVTLGVNANAASNKSVASVTYLNSDDTKANGGDGSAFNSRKSMDGDTTSRGASYEAETVRDEEDNEEGGDAFGNGSVFVGDVPRPLPIIMVDTYSDGTNSSTTTTCNSLEKKDLHTASSEPALSQNSTFKLHRLRKSQTADSFVGNSEDADDAEGLNDSLDDNHFAENLRRTMDTLFPANVGAAVGTPPASAAGGTNTNNKAASASATPTRKELKPRRRSGADEQQHHHGAGNRRGKSFFFIVSLQHLFLFPESYVNVGGGNSPAPAHGEGGGGGGGGGGGHSYAAPTASTAATRVSVGNGAFADSLRTEIDHNDARRGSSNTNPNSRSRSVSPGHATGSASGTHGGGSPSHGNSTNTNTGATTNVYVGGGSYSILGGNSTPGSLGGTTPPSTALPTKPEFIRPSSGVRSSTGIASAANLIIGSNTNSNSSATSGLSNLPPPLHRNLSRTISNGIGRSTSEPRTSADDSSGDVSTPVSKNVRQSSGRYA
jgi:hypothetical protein